MRAGVALRALNAITAYQWGMVTTAQAAARGIGRMQLSRLANDGHLERLGHGIYRDAGAPAGRFEGLKAAWLSVDPGRTAEERLFQRPRDVVVSGAAASWLLGIGDLVPEPYEFTTPTRRQTQRFELVYRMRRLPEGSITIREGLPVTRPEQTIADLLEEKMDRSLVADVLRDVGNIDRDWLAKLLAPLAGRQGFRPGDGEAFRDELERLANRDIDSLVRAVSAAPFDPMLKKRIWDLAARTGAQADPAIAVGHPNGGRI